MVLSRSVKCSLTSVLKATLLHFELCWNSFAKAVHGEFDLAWMSKPHGRGSLHKSVVTLL